MSQEKIGSVSRKKKTGRPSIPKSQRLSETLTTHCTPEVRKMFERTCRSEKRRRRLPKFSQGDAVREAVEQWIERLAAERAVG
jgi:hypothetical protein